MPGEARAVLERLIERYGLVGASPGGGPRRRGAGRHRRALLRGQPRAGAAAAGGRASRGRIPRSAGSASGGGSPSSSPRIDGGRGLDRGRDCALEDKGPIQALHWRGAEDEAQAEASAHEIAVEAGRAGLEPRWGRKVLELRPVGGGGKDAAVASLLAADGSTAPSTRATTAPTSTPSAGWASSATRASWSPRSASASSPPRGRRRSPRSPTSPSTSRPGWLEILTWLAE